MTGIYKITSPSGKVYIGQSWNIISRWTNYRASQCKGQIGLYRSLSKHGKMAHRFEILHQLPVDVGQSILDEYEKLYISAHKEAGLTMLNMTEGGKGGKPTEEILIKLRRPKSEQHRANIAAAVKKQWDDGTKKYFHDHSPQWKAKVSASKMGHSVSEETRKKISASNKGKPSNSGCFKKGVNLKLTSSKVSEIRAKFKPRAYTRKMLAVEYGVSFWTIGRIVTNKIYM